eukprot:TRINITY_DN13719_c0_g1_i3.p2 TRINITY_DN13719_c0_g1~~TRINITY_DN13719_c0_g1_i3.p2  ORF type:complete len:246 (+),score=81.48 TRINITY_DN13719_c0_g1_i3:503-1240(+)
MVAQPGSAGKNTSDLFGLASTGKMDDAAKRRRGLERMPKAEEVEEPEVIEMVARLAVLSTSMANTVKAIVCDTLILPTKCPVVSAMNEATKRFHVEANAKATPAEKSRMGPPYVRAVQALLQAVLNNLGDLTPEEKTLYEKPIMQYVTQVHSFNDENEKMMFLTDTFKMCRCSPCYNKDKSKIEVSVFHGPVVLADHNHAPAAWVAIMRYLIRKQNAEKKAGGPPAGSLERALSKKFGLKKKKDE